MVHIGEWIQQFISHLMYCLGIKSNALSGVGLRKENFSMTHNTFLTRLMITDHSSKNNKNINSVVFLAHNAFENEAIKSVLF